MPQCSNPACRKETGDLRVCQTSDTPLPPNAATPVLRAGSNATRSPSSIVPPARGRTLTVGRSPGLNIRLSEHDDVSRHHAVRLAVEDTGSTNGTWIDGARFGTRGSRGTGGLRNESIVSFGRRAAAVLRVVCAPGCAEAGPGGEWRGVTDPSG